MKIIVFGAAGEVGLHLLLDLARDTDCDELIAADIDVHRLAELDERQLRKDRFKAVVVDVADTRKAVELAQGADLLMNCTSFAHFDRVLDVAIKAKVNYADLISDPSRAQREAAAEAGILAVSGLGSSPGLTNVLVRDAVEDFDRVDSVDIGCVSFRSIAPSRGFLDTIVWELSEFCPQRVYYEDGQYRWAHAGEGTKMYEFREPIGRQTLQFVPHSEAVTLPRNFPSLRWCAVRGTWRPDIMDAFRVLNRLGMLDNPAQLEAATDALWRRFGGRFDGHWSEGVDQVDVVGLREGILRHRVYRTNHPPDWQVDAIGRTTGICAGVGAYLIARDPKGQIGFVDPEIFFEPAEFLEELAGRGSVTVTTSEEDAVVDAPVWAGSEPAEGVD